MVEDLRKGEWVLFLLNERGPLTHSQISDICKKLRSEDSQRDVILSSRTFYLVYDDYSKKGLIRKVSVQAGTTKRRYPGYEITPKGKRYLSAKLGQQQVQTIATLNAIASEEMDGLVASFNEYMREIDVPAALYDAVYDEGLLLAAAIDQEYFIKLHQNSIESETERVALFYKVLLYVSLHSFSVLGDFLEGGIKLPEDLASLKAFCIQQDLKYVKATDTRQEILAKTGALKLKIILDKSSRTHSGSRLILPFLDLPAGNASDRESPSTVTTYVMATSFELQAVRALVSNVIRKQFLQCALGERIVSIDRIVDDIFDRLGETNIFPASMLGISTQDSPSIELMPSFEQDFPESPQQQHFKTFLRLVVGEEVEMLVTKQQQGLLEIPPTLLAELGVINAKALIEVFGEEIGVQYQNAVTFMREKRWAEAVTILENLFANAHSAAQSEIYSSLTQCYRATSAYRKILPKFKALRKEQSPSDLQFQEYLEVLIDLGKFDQFTTILREWVIANAPPRISREPAPADDFPNQFFAAANFSNPPRWMYDLLLESMVAQGRCQDLWAGTANSNTLIYPATPIYLECCTQTGDFDAGLESCKAHPLILTNPGVRDLVKAFCAKMRFYATFYAAHAVDVEDLLQQDLKLLFVMQRKWTAKDLDLAGNLDFLANDIGFDEAQAPHVAALGDLLVAMGKTDQAKNLVSRFMMMFENTPMRLADRFALQNLSDSLSY